jgi:hypothetical protein
MDGEHFLSQSTLHLAAISPRSARPLCVCSLARHHRLSQHVARSSRPLARDARPGARGRRRESIVSLSPRPNSRRRQSHFRLHRLKRVDGIPARGRGIPQSPERISTTGDDKGWQTAPSMLQVSTRKCYQPTVRRMLHNTHKAVPRLDLPLWRSFAIGPK